MSTPKEFIITD